MPHLANYPAVIELIGGSPAAERARAAMNRASDSNDPVLISAETGLNLSTVARAIHDASSRASLAFAPIDCAAHDARELADRIFGGLTTGGTVVLENLNELPTQLQARLALVLRDGQIEVEGSGHAIAVDVRIVATVCGNIDEDIRNDTLRRDLCSRFLLRIDLPPLRQRPSDIPILIGCLVAEAAPASQVPLPTFSREALTLLAALPWRRNFEELREVIDVLVLSAVGGTVRLEDVLGHVPLERMSASHPNTASLREARMSFEREYIASVLRRHRGRMEEAARSLGVQRTNLYRKVRQLGIGITRAK
jgi:DNA-binding NtrC family response regulator